MISDSQLTPGAIILIVDDQAMSRAVLGQYIRSILGCCVVSFESPGEALRWSEENHFDVAILDYRLPGMDGLAWAGRLKALCPHCNIVLISADDVDGLVSRKVKASVSAFILKSRGLDVIVEQARVLL